MTRGHGWDRKKLESALEERYGRVRRGRGFVTKGGQHFEKYDLYCGNEEFEVTVTGNEANFPVVDYVALTRWFRNVDWQGQRGQVIDFLDRSLEVAEFDTDKHTTSLWASFFASNVPESRSGRFLAHFLPSWDRDLMLACETVENPAFTQDSSLTTEAGKILGRMAAASVPPFVANVLVKRSVENDIILQAAEAGTGGCQQCSGSGRQLFRLQACSGCDGSGSVKLSFAGLPVRSPDRRQGSISA